MDTKKVARVAARRGAPVLLGKEFTNVDALSAEESRQLFNAMVVSLEPDDSDGLVQSRPVVEEREFSLVGDSEKYRMLKRYFLKIWLGDPAPQAVLFISWAKSVRNGISFKDSTGKSIPGVVSGRFIDDNKCVVVIDQRFDTGTVVFSTNGAVVMEMQIENGVVV